MELRTRGRRPGPHALRRPASSCWPPASLPARGIRKEVLSDFSPQPKAPFDPGAASRLLPLCPLPSRFPGGRRRGVVAPRAPRGRPGPRPRAARSRPHYSVWAAIQQEEAQIHRPKEMQTRWRAKQRSR